MRQVKDGIGKIVAIQYFTYTWKTTKLKNK